MAHVVLSGTLGKCREELGEKKKPLKFLQGLFYDMNFEITAINVVPQSAVFRERYLHHRKYAGNRCHREGWTH